MRTLRVLGFCLCFALVPRALALDEFLDRFSEALTFNTLDGGVRARLRGTLDLEIYHLDVPALLLLYPVDDYLVSERLTLYLDGQFGPHVYVFAQARIDRGFDPSEGDVEARLDEYAVRISPWPGGHFNLQLGKF